MVDSVGKRLRQARLRQAITVDQAAHETKVRADRIADLENDDYTNFPNMTYAKGFLVIYARFLGVDVTDFLGGWENASPVSMEDYQYLNNAPERRPSVERSPQEKPVWPLLLVVALVIAAATCAYFVLTLKRLGATVETTHRAEPSTPIEVLATPVPRAAPLSPAARSSAAPQMTAPAPAATGAPMAVAATPPPSGAIKQITLRPLKKTWVKVFRDVPNSTPVFEDWLYPDARALTFSGTKFWIEVADPKSIEVSQDGVAVPASDKGYAIQ